MYLGGDLFKVDNKAELANLQTMLALSQYAATGAGQQWSALVKVAWEWNTNTAGNNCTDSNDSTLLSDDC